MTRNANERGLLSTELAILMPIMVLVAVVAVFVIQTGRHDSRAQQAADAAARAASLTRSEPAARSAAQAAAEAVCDGPVAIPVWEWKAPQLDSYTPGRVRLALTCTEQFTGLSPLLNDQTRTENGYSVSVIEYWAENS